MPETGGTSRDCGIGLRIAREARGFSQQQLAGMAGITRQTVSAVETGSADPSLRVALALGRALGLSVEEVFGPATPAPCASVQPVAPLGETGSRVALAPIGDTFVALPLTGAAAAKGGFVPATGLAGEVSAGEPRQRGRRAPGSAAARSVQPIGPPQATLVVADDDPALPLLEFPAWPAPSAGGFHLVAVRQ